MKNRIIVSVVYVIVWIGLCALKWLTPNGWGSLGFDALFCAVSVIGSIELLRALGNVSYVQKVLAIAFCAVVVPLYVAAELTMSAGFLAVGCCGVIYAFVLAALNVFQHDKCSIRGTANCYLTMLYCGVLSCMLSAVNHLEYNSMAAIILLFISVVFTDSGAFIIGGLLKKVVPFKLAPKLSPNKTVIGAIGGLVGGMVGAVLAYLLFYYLGGVIGTPLVYEGTLHPAILYMVIGFVTSVLAQVGDLFESAIKRECGIKDMGKLMPGHGGVLDRFDSMLFSGVVVLFSFGVIIV